MTIKSEEKQLMKREEDNIILVKSKALALSIIKLYKFLCDEKKEYVLSKQVLRSGTSIGANVKEAVSAQSKADFVSKLFISLKEANETEYWLELLHESNFIEDVVFDEVYAQNKEVVKIITSILKTTRNN